jgi:hypothetical protein
MLDIFSKPFASWSLIDVGILFLWFIGVGIGVWITIVLWSVLKEWWERWEGWWDELGPLDKFVFVAGITALVVLILLAASSRSSVAKPG